MNITLVRRTGFACLALFVLVLLMLPIVQYAATAPGELEACVNPGNGGLRLVDSAEPCHRNETRVTWNITGPAGPPGPPGPPGPSSGGAPFVWICTPAHRPLSSGSPRDDVYVFNGNSSTANIAVNILDKDGNNLAGLNIPGSNPVKTYPGEAGAATVALLPAHTRDVDWVMPDADAGPAFTNVAFSVRVTSDQPIVVGANFQFNGDIPSQCNLLPK